jgi:hypothetical protein
MRIHITDVFGILEEGSIITAADWEVKLNGKVYTNVIEADDKEGYIRCIEYLRRSGVSGSSFQPSVESYVLVGNVEIICRDEYGNIHYHTGEVMNTTLVKIENEKDIVVDTVVK